MSEVYNLKSSGLQQGYISEDGSSSKNAYVINTTNFIPIASPMSVASIANELCYFINAAEAPVSPYATFSAVVNYANLNSIVYRDDYAYLFLTFDIPGYRLPVPGISDGQVLHCTLLVAAPRNNWGVQIDGDDFTISTTGNPSGGAYEQIYTALWSGNSSTRFNYSVKEFTVGTASMGDSISWIKSDDNILTPDDIFQPEEAGDSINAIEQTSLDEYLVHGKVKIYGYSEANVNSEIFHTDAITPPYDIDWTGHNDAKYFRVEIIREMEGAQQALIKPTHVMSSTITGSGVWALDSDEELTNAWLGDTLPEDLFTEPYPARFWFYDTDIDGLNNYLLPQEPAGGAFMNCTTLEYVSIPESVQYIGKYAFTHTSLTKVRISKTCTYYPTSFPPGCEIWFYGDEVEPADDFYSKAEIDAMMIRLGILGLELFKISDLETRKISILEGD